MSEIDFHLLTCTHGSYRPKLVQLYTGDGYLLLDAQGALERILSSGEAPPADLESAADVLARQVDYTNRLDVLDLYAKLRVLDHFRTCPHGYPVIISMERNLPARVGRFLIALTHQQVEPDHNDILIRIEQGISFGNGSHETTRMALELLQEHLRPGDRVADVGCGTGILSIAAAKLDAGEIAAVDTDPLCILESEENLALNGVRSRVMLTEGSSEQLEGEFDLVIANMSNAPMILEVAPAAINWLKRGGIFIVGGIYAYQEFTLENRMEFVREGLEGLGLELLNTLKAKHCAMSFRKGG